jgi:uracil-DNA glycosylase family 4
MVRSHPSSVEPSRSTSTASVLSRLEGRGTAWEDLNREIIHCTLCPLHRTRTHAVPYRGSLRPRILFIGEAPGAAEDLRGVPFVGRAGRVLDRAISELGLPEASYGVTNVVKCRPPANRFDRLAERSCRPYLDRQLALLRPKGIVTLGAFALRALLPEAPPITRSAGRAVIWSGRPIFPMLHPASTFRSRAYAARWQEDLERLKALLPAWGA